MSVKHKILNDPVYGFINMPSGVNKEIVEHTWFQRLRNIRQLGLTGLVYPGAIHTRFQHTLGAYHLICNAVDEIREKGYSISKEEEEALRTAILLHDIGHGPFSHALEYVLMPEISHEFISNLVLDFFNTQYQGNLTLASQIFNDTYPRKFLHQLISSQLDMDRLDYLKRDSFFTGVSEGVTGTERIIKMLTVHNDSLVIESKGVYSIEKFLISRRLMYWQVYLHKTVLAAEQLLIKIIERARMLTQQGVSIECPASLRFFLERSVSKNDCKNFDHPNNPLHYFMSLDDNDVLSAIKIWMNSSDNVLSLLSSMLINRRLFKIEMQRNPFSEQKVEDFIAITSHHYQISSEDARFMVFTNSATNNAYNPDDESIKILYKNGEVVDITEASDILNISVLGKNVVKYFLCYPEVCRTKSV